MSNQSNQSPELHPDPNNFFAYQQRALQPLKQWGLSSVLVGAIAAAIPQPSVRQFGLQCLTWGGIDAGLALFGMRQASRKEAQYYAGELPSVQVAREIRTLHRILMINTALDVGYVAAAIWLLATAQDRPARLGTGLGVLVQGSFLLGYDALFAQDIGRNWPSEVAA